MSLLLIEIYNHQLNWGKLWSISKHHFLFVGVLVSFCITCLSAFQLTNWTNAEHNPVSIEWGQLGVWEASHTPSEYPIQQMGCSSIIDFYSTQDYKCKDDLAWAQQCNRPILRKFAKICDIWKEKNILINYEFLLTRMLYFLVSWRELFSALGIATVCQHSSIRKRRKHETMQNLQFLTLVRCFNVSMCSFLLVLKGCACSPA